jgi:hypothetical protein
VSSEARPNAKPAPCQKRGFGKMRVLVLDSGLAAKRPRPGMTKKLDPGFALKERAPG